VYRPLAEVLIGTGLRISEALALRVSDIQLETKGGMIVVYRSRKRGETVGSTKSDRFRSVEIGPELSLMLRWRPASPHARWTTPGSLRRSPGACAAWTPQHGSGSPRRTSGVS
jgi:integrase